MENCGIIAVGSKGEGKLEESPHILVVDDDPEVLRLTKRFLGQFNYRVTTASDSKEAYAALEAWNIACVVLDVMLPGQDGYSILRKVRSRGQLPVIMLTAMRDDSDRILGLELGADDYLGKPFNPRELLARIRAVLRRVAAFGAPSPTFDTTTVAFADYVLNLRTHELKTIDGKTISLTAGEFTLLSVLIQHHGKVLSRDQLADFIHHCENDPLGRRIDLLVSRLRRKIEEDQSEPKIIKTVWGKGYRFSEIVTGFDL